MTAAKHGDDIATVAAVAVLATCIATAAHEAVGHGLTCLALGGEITQLTSVYFQCSAQSTGIAAGGPLGNLLAARIAGWAFTLTPKRHSHLRLALLLVLALSLFWFAGYLIYSAALRTGDLFFVALDLFGPPTLALRIGAIIAGTLIYFLAVNVIRRLGAALSRDPKRVRRLLVISWVAAALSATAAAFAYAPSPVAAATQAALEIAAASLPLLARAMVAPIGPADPAAVAPRSWAWIGASIVAYALFIATLGRGLPW